MSKELEEQILKIKRELNDISPSSFKHIKTINDLKSWEDVCFYKGIKEEEVLPFKSPKTKLEKVTNAFFKINIISEIFNEDWKPDFNNSKEKKYYLYFERRSVGWVVNAANWLADFAFVGSGFYFKNKETALLIGERFLDLFNDYLPE